MARLVPGAPAHGYEIKRGLPMLVLALPAALLPTAAVSAMAARQASTVDPVRALRAE